MTRFGPEPYVISDDEMPRGKPWRTLAVSLISISLFLVLAWAVYQLPIVHSREEFPPTSFGMLRVSEEGEVTFFRPRRLEETSRAVVFAGTTYPSRDDLPILWLPEALPEPIGLEPFNPEPGSYLRRAGSENDKSVTLASLPRGKDIPLLVVRNASRHPWCERMLTPGSLLLFLSEEGV